MLRAALRPRGILVFLVLVAFTGACILLGTWQWHRTQDILAVDRAALETPVPIADLVPMDSTSLAVESLGRRILDAGEYVTGMQTLVVNRELDGKAGVWVVSGFRLADGRVTAVVRGWSAADAVPQIDGTPGRVEITGVMHPNETFYADAETPAGTVASISSDRLSEEWGTELIPGFVVLSSQTPSPATAPLPVPPTVQVSNVPFPLQNFFYAFQWWIFAVLAWIAFFRWLYVDARGRSASA